VLSPTDIAGRTAVVTGAAYGIGNAIATRLIEHGAKLVAIDNDAEALEAAFGAADAATVEGDLGAPDTGALAERVISEHGPVELLVNNVGIQTQHRFLELEEADFDLVLGTNLRGPWFFTKRLVQGLIDAERPGAVVFISSIHDKFVFGKPHYSVSKAAVAMLVKELARTLGPHRIRVNSISPGAILTHTNVGELERPIIPLGRAGLPDDIARMAIVLLSDEFAGYMTGASVRVDGGAGLPDI
jgi:glucose 1-dehydrogenase